jgi:hypothetical protein
MILHCRVVLRIAKHEHQRRSMALTDIHVDMAVMGAGMGGVAADHDEGARGERLHAAECVTEWHDEDDGRQRNNHNPIE